MCRNVKCFRFIMNSQSFSDDGKGSLVPPFKVIRRKFVHLLSIGRTCVKEGLSVQHRRTWFIFFLCSNSAKSRRVMTQKFTRSISTCRQFLQELIIMIIYKEVNSLSSNSDTCYLFRINSFASLDFKILEFLETNNVVMDVFWFPN